MSKLKSKKVIIPLVVVAVVALIVAWFVLSNGITTYQDKYAGFNLEAGDSDASQRKTMNYAKYLAQYADVSKPTTEVEVDITSYTQASTEVETIYDYEGESVVVQGNEDGTVEWLVNVPQEGMYNIYVEYIPIESRGVSTERILYINEEIPFTGADALNFNRVWTDNGEVKQDNQGNDIRPSQVELPVWQSAYFKDDKIGRAHV